MLHIKFRDTDLCKACMPTYTSFQKVGITIDEILGILQESCNCEVCEIIKDKLKDFTYTNEF